MTLCKHAQIMQNCVILLHLDTLKLVLECQLSVVTIILKQFSQCFPYCEQSLFSVDILDNMISTPSNMILLALATYFFHWERLWVSDAWGFSTSALMYYISPLSFNTASMQSFQTPNIEMPSKAYSSPSPLKSIYSVLKKTCNIDLQIWTSCNDNFKISIL